jgi:Rod binding domain-containing protein
MSNPITISTGLPIVNQALEPKSVRDGSPATQKAYQSALGFEDALVEQLSKSLTESSGLTRESSEQGSEEGGVAGGTGDSELASLLPQGLTSSVMSAGGLGLAAQMTRQLEGTDAKASTGTQAQASGGVHTP